MGELTPERITDAAATPDQASGGMLSSIQPEYSTVSPFNCDNTLLILVHQSYFGLYSVPPRAFLSSLPFSINASSEPRWSTVDPETLFYLSRNELRRYSVVTGKTVPVRRFTEFDKVSGKGEGDISEDGDHFVFCGDDRKIFSYQISRDLTSAPLLVGPHSLDGLYATPDNNVLVSWGERGTGRYQGVELFDGDMNFIRQVANAGGHMDVTRRQEGREALVWCNSGAANPVCPNGVVLVDLQSEPAEHTCLVPLDWSLSLHISAPDRAGFVFVSTERQFDNLADGAFANELLLVGVDGAVRSLGPHRSRIKDYNAQPKVSCSRDGRWIVFGSNSGGEVMDTYLMQVESPRTRPYRPPRGPRVPPVTHRGL